MFDSHTHKHGPQSLTVAVNQQPADAADTARLLKELEAQAVQNVVSTHYIMQDNLLRAVSVVFAPGPLSMMYEWIICFSLNERKYKVHTEISAMAWQDARRDPSRLTKMIVTTFASAIAEEIFRQGIGIAEFDPSQLEQMR